MAKYAVGEAVGIPCAVQPGAFPHEVLVTFETGKETISGFVRSGDVLSRQGHQGYIPGTVKAVSSDVLTVVVKGSFFTTTGLVYLRRDWADSKLRHLDRQVA